MTTLQPTLTVLVARKAVEAQDICSFELVDPQGGALPAFSAGSHVDVHLPSGLTRQYSLCNDPRESHRYLIAVLRDPASRGGSAAMHDEVLAGQQLQISEPKNHFAIAHDAKHHLLLAGGIGITPILCMAERLARIDASFDMHYSARSRKRAAFLGRLAAAELVGRVQLHFDDGDIAQKLDLPAVLTAPQAGTHLYVCGPNGFMDAVLDAARSAGWAEPNLHWEFFGAASLPSVVQAAFEVQVASSGQVIAVAAGCTVVQALAAAGVEVPVSCEQGVCGTCLTRVIAGEPDHRDMFLTPEEQALNDQFLPCCSRSKTPRLVLDL